jgi:hypothetical protein
MKGGDKMGKYLINVSNHPAKTWPDEQKAGWDGIYDIPFPEVTPDVSLDELATKVYHAVEETIQTAAILQSSDVYVMIKGDYGLCYKLYELFKDKFTIVHPISVKDSTDETLSDGSIKKTIIYKFIKWIIIS